jgi:hypothetical protein
MTSDQPKRLIFVDAARTNMEPSPLPERIGAWFGYRFYSMVSFLRDVVRVTIRSMKK